MQYERVYSGTKQSKLPLHFFLSDRELNNGPLAGEMTQNMFSTTRDRKQNITLHYYALPLNHLRSGRGLPSNDWHVILKAVSASTVELLSPVMVSRSGGSITMDAEFTKKAIDNHFVMTRSSYSQCCE